MVLEELNKLTFDLFDHLLALGVLGLVLIKPAVLVILYQERLVVDKQVGIKSVLYKRA